VRRLPDDTRRALTKPPDRIEGMAESCIGELHGGKLRLGI
jgi:hypothetical protein